MKLKVDVIVNPVLFEEEDTGLVELAIDLEDENKSHSSVPVAVLRI